MVPNIGATSNPGSPGGVPRNVKVAAANLRLAEPLDLLHVVQSAAAGKLVAAIVPAVAGTENRQRRRRAGGAAKLERAVAAVLGGVLEAALTAGVPVRRSMSAEAFDGTVPTRQAIAALDGLERSGLIHRYNGIRYQVALGDLGTGSGGRVARFAATGALLEQARQFGLTSETIGGAFRRVYPDKPPRRFDPLVLRPLTVRRNRHAKRGGDPRLLIPAHDTVAAALRAEVKAANAVLDRHVWAGCQPPRLYRAFRASNVGEWNLGGRWIVAGTSRTIQAMPEKERLNIAIDGAPVGEVDATASQLSILAAHAGTTTLPDDPYAIGYDRPVVKAAVVATLGNGGLPRRWPARTLAEKPELAAVDIRPLSDALGERYPFLQSPEDVLGVEKGRVALRLQFLEAEILTAAMRGLWARDVPVIPIHDSLLCPATEIEAANTAMIEAYATYGHGAVIRTKLERATA